MATEQSRIPDDLKYVIGNDAPPEVQFRTASKYMKPGVLAMMTCPPYSGGPLVGFVIKTADDERSLVKGFCISYCNTSSSRFTEEHVGLDKLLELEFTCMSATLASTVALVNKEKGDSMMAQYEASRTMMAQVGISM